MTASLADHLDAVVAGTFVRVVEHHDEIGSTNDCARELGADGPLPALVVAERQSAGRGRGGNSWWGGDGALLFSVVLDRATVPLPDDRRSLVALATGLAVRSAVVTVHPEVDVRLKWPNDLLVDDRKLCGILVEEANGRTVIGIGLNAENSLSTAPAEVRTRGVSLVDLVDSTVDRSVLLRAILRHLEAEIARLGSMDEDDRLDRRWSAHCALTGRVVAVRSHDRLTEGYCEGIDEVGALLLRTSIGRERILSGTVESR